MAGCFMTMAARFVVLTSGLLLAATACDLFTTPDIDEARASTTPGMRLRALLTRVSQARQVMPVTWTVIVVLPGACSDMGSCRSWRRGRLWGSPASMRPHTPEG